MKLNTLSALMLAAGAIAMPALTHAAAVDLDSCCTPGDQDFPKVGGNLGNQNYSSLKQITRTNVKTLGGHGSSTSTAASASTTRARPSSSTA